MKNLHILQENIYITSDEEIKDGDWFLTDDKRVEKCAPDWRAREWHKKIILTTDQDLIIDGVQAIDDEFLQWFVKNPSCEFVKVEEFEPIYGHQNNSNSVLYKIIIPSVEPKQETLEEATEKVYISHKNNDLLYGHSEELQLAYKAGVVDGVKFQQERSYSEEEVIAFGEFIFKNTLLTHAKGVKNLFEQFKNK